MLFLMKEDYTSFCCSGCSVDAGYSKLPTGVEILTLMFTPPVVRYNQPIVFVPGLASVIDNFREILTGLTEHFRVVYIETREKSTARVDRHHGFSVDEVSSDIYHFVNDQIKEKDYILVGYSLGATAIAEAFDALHNKPSKMVLLEPNAGFNFPWWSLILARIGTLIFKPARPFLKWYIRKFRVNTADDIEMYNINCRILDAAEPRRISRTIRALKPYRAGNHLQKISVPVLVIGASKDKFHNHDEALHFSEKIPGCRYTDMVDNKRTHSIEAAEKIRDFVRG